MLAVWALLTGLVLTAVLMPLFIKLMKKFSFSQTILKYVEEHKAKQGTPTMGGVVFMLITLIVALCFLKFDKSWFVVLMVGLGFALIGGLDDFLKIKYKRNLGLRAYQKIVGQLGIAILFSLYIYNNVGTSITIPFFNHEISLGVWIIPFVVLVCLATTNAVNLTDGLDGLAGGVSLVVGFVSIIFFCIIKLNLYNLGESNVVIGNYSNMIVLMSIFTGCLAGFLIYNSNKASIFMGDVGSLGIGGLLASVYSFLGLELALVFVGICYIVSTLSVIIQVVVYKKTKKRVFKMAPIHHHFQKCGFSEAKICTSYKIITLIMGLLLIVSVL